MIITKIENGERITSGVREDMGLGRLLRQWTYIG